ncbi:serine/threonine protein kinase [Stackebrandtia albiflava]|uniref:Serine/threonine protein kinase n=1 Tax=Stackebrandtia albiflava TaxID=406432 RepID=A0A562V311_9ACTN|nr:serine/threonine protein kinase [Stackebrandtia albiflava]TWJ12245.1 serine/threonine protein kinase [Stackebrandtia albiflava]
MEQLDAVDPERIGDYRIFGRLGSGGMGTVYLGLAPDRRQVAVKTLRSPIPATPSADRRRFHREAEALSRIDNPYLVRILDADTTGDPPWIAMEYLKGDTLSRYVGQQGPLTEQALGTLALCLSEALTTLHEHGILHRDLKPDNVMLTDDGAIVIDLGITLLDESTRYTSVGVVVGVPAYLPPEVWRGHPAGPAGDVFAMGAVLHCAATGRSLLGEGTHGELAARGAGGTYDLSGLPRPWAAIVTECVATDPARRPSAADMFDRFTERMGVAPPSPGWWRRHRDAPSSPVDPAAITTVLPRPPRRRRTMITAVAAACVLSLMAAGITAWRPWPTDAASFITGAGPSPSPDDTAAPTDSGEVQLHNVATGLCLYGDALGGHDDGEYGAVLTRQCDPDSGDAFLWERTDLGQYRNVETGLCLADKVDMEPAVTLPCDKTHENQFWREYRDPDLKLKNDKTGLCLHSRNMAGDDGAVYGEVKTKECVTDGEYQSWEPHEVATRTP